MEFPRGNIRRTSPIPFYFQLMELLENQIVHGDWEVGSRIPPENAICKHFGVSRSTVRQALAELESRGLIHKERGHGSFVAQARPVSWSLNSWHGLFYDESVRRGHEVKSKVLRAEIGPIPSRAAAALGLEPVEERTGVTIERLRWVDDRLVNYAVNYLPADYADSALSADLESGSLYEALREKGGINIFGTHRVLEAVPATGDLVRLLQADPGSPLLLVESVSWNEEFRIFDCCWAWNHTGRMKIDIRVDREHGASMGPVSASYVANPRSEGVSRPQ